MAFAPAAPMDMETSHELGSIMLEGGIDRAYGDVAPEDSTPNAYDPMGGPAGDYKKALIVHLRERTELARSLSAQTHYNWSRYELMRKNQWRLDDPTDVLSQQGVYVPLTARRIDVAIASILSEAIPDQTNLNFFDTQGKIEHLDEYVDKAKEALRNCFMGMRPKDSTSYSQLVRMRVDNTLTFGNSFSLITIDDFPAENGNFVSGPCAQWLDPFNVLPHDVDVSDATETDFSLFQPLDERQLQATGYPPEMIAYIRENYPADIQSRRDDEAYAVQGSYYDGRMTSSPLRRLYRRWVYIGRWPGHELRDDTLPPDEEIWPVLGEEFNFTPQESTVAEWWHMEWIGHTLTACQPYPIALPRGTCPITHGRLFKVPGQIYGYGMYHRTEWHERFYNKYLRAVLRYSMLMSNPPGVYDKTAIDAAYLQKIGAKFPSLAPGVWIPANRALGTQTGGLPLQALPFGAEAIQPMMDQMAYHEQTINEITGITDAVEGDDESRTATQNANNLQQSLKTIFDYIGTIESDILLPDVQKCYVAMQQCYLMASEGFFQLVSGDPSQQAYRSLMVRPEDLLDQTLFDFIITGSTSPGNKQNQIKAFQESVGQLAPFPGLLNMPNVARYLFEMHDIKNIDALVNSFDPAQVLSKLMNIIAMFGGDSVQAYMMMAQDPQISQAIGLQNQMQGGPKGLPAPGGGERGPAGQPPIVSQGGGNGGTMQGNSSLPPVNPLKISSPSMARNPSPPMRPVG